MSHRYGYTEVTGKEFSPTTLDAWTAYDLKTNHGIPANRVVQMWCGIRNTQGPGTIGLRKVGSSLERKLQLTPPLGGNFAGNPWGGPAAHPFFVELSGREEDYNSFRPSATGAWTRVNLNNLPLIYTGHYPGPSIPPSAVVEIWCGTDDGAANIGVRSASSGDDRRLNVAAPRSEGENGYTIHVQLDEGWLEYYSSSSNGIFRILGYWNPDLFAWIEAWDSVAIGADGWTLQTLGLPANVIFEAIAYHDSGSVHTMSVSSGTSNFGDLIAMDVDGAAATFIAKTDADSQANFFSSPAGASGSYYITGYWVVNIPYVTDFCRRTSVDTDPMLSAAEPTSWRVTSGAPEVAIEYIMDGDLTAANYAEGLCGDGTYIYQGCQTPACVSKIDPFDMSVAGVWNGTDLVTRIVYVAGYLYAMRWTNGSIYKIDPVTMGTAGSVTSGYGVINNDLVTDGTFIYLLTVNTTSGYTTIWKFNTNLGLVTAVTYTSNLWASSFAYHDGYLYACCRNGLVKSLFKVSTSDLSRVTSTSSYGGVFICTDGTYLYVSDYTDSLLRKFDAATLSFVSSLSGGYWFCYYYLGRIYCSSYIGGTVGEYVYLINPSSLTILSTWTVATDVPYYRTVYLYAENDYLYGSAVRTLNPTKCVKISTTGFGYQWGGVALAHCRHSSSSESINVGARNLFHEGERKWLINKATAGAQPGVDMLVTYNRMRGTVFPTGLIQTWEETGCPNYWLRYTYPEGERGFMMHVKTDEYGRIQYYASSDPATAAVPGLYYAIGEHVVFRIMGYYGEDVDFTEQWETVVNTVANTWEQIALSSPANRVVELISVGEQRQVGVAWGREYPGGTDESTPQGFISQEGGFTNNPMNNLVDDSTWANLDTACTWLTATDALQKVYLKQYTLNASKVFYVSGYFDEALKYYQPSLTEGLFTDDYGAWATKRLSAYDRIKNGFKEYGCDRSDYWGEVGGARNNIEMGPICLLFWHGVDSCAQYCGARTRGSYVDRRIPLPARLLGDTVGVDSRLGELSAYRGNATTMLTMPDEDGYFSFFQQSPYYTVSEYKPQHGPFTRITGILYWQWYNTYADLKCRLAVGEDSAPLYRTPSDMEAV